jgi:hypothetical protein
MCRYFAWRYVVLASALVACGNKPASSLQSGSTGGVSATAGAYATSGGTTGLGGMASAAGGGASGDSHVGVAGVAGVAGGAFAASIPVEDLCVAFKQELCTYLMQCRHKKYKDLNHCQQEVDCLGVNALIESVASKRSVYDPVRTAECLRLTHDSPCKYLSYIDTPSIFELLRTCPGIINPNQVEGAVCIANEECRDSLPCVKTLGCPGKCTKKVPVPNGGDCSVDACATGLHCNWSQICVPNQVAGDPCDADGSCAASVESCVVGGSCPRNLWCDTTTMTCRAARLEHETCGGTPTQGYCALGLWCNGVDPNPGHCQTPNGLNGPCLSNQNSCTSNLQCVYTEDTAFGTCTEPQVTDVGCRTWLDCQSGLVCNAGVCQAPGAIGWRCAGDETCAAGLVCSASNLCQAALYPGDICNQSSLKCTLSRCVSGTCTYHAHVGEVCTSASDCFSLACVGGRCYDNYPCPAR